MISNINIKNWSDNTSENSKTEHINLDDPAIRKAFEKARKFLEENNNLHTIECPHNELHYAFDDRGISQFEILKKELDAAGLWEINQKLEKILSTKGESAKKAVSLPNPPSPKIQKTDTFDANGQLLKIPISLEAGSSQNPKQLLENAFELLKNTSDFVKNCEDNEILSKLAEEYKETKKLVEKIQGDKDLKLEISGKDCSIGKFENLLKSFAGKMVINSEGKGEKTPLKKSTS